MPVKRNRARSGSAVIVVALKASGLAKPLLEFLDLSSVIQSEADLHCHLPMPNFVILQVAAHFDDLKPFHIPYSFAGPADCVVHCVLDAAWSGTNEFDLFVNVVTHEGY